MIFSLSERVLSHSSCVQLSTSPWTIAPQAPLSLDFSRQEYWSGLPFPPPEDLPDPGIKPVSSTSAALAGRFFTTSATLKRSKRRSSLRTRRRQDSGQLVPRGPREASCSLTQVQRNEAENCPICVKKPASPGAVDFKTVCWISENK